MTDNTYKAVDPEGREWTLRPVPAHIQLMFGQLPTSISEAAIRAMDQGDSSVLEQEVQANLTTGQRIQGALFARQAIEYAVVRPRITLTPDGSPDEISPFEISEEVFIFLTKRALNPGGADAEKARTFRAGPGQTAVAGARGKKHRTGRK